MTMDLKKSVLLLSVVDCLLAFVNELGIIYNELTQIKEHKEHNRTHCKPVRYIGAGYAGYPSKTLLISQSDFREPASNDVTPSWDVGVTVRLADVT